MIKEYQSVGKDAVLTGPLHDVNLSIDSGEVSVAVLLDLTAAFKTVNHNIFIDGLEQRFGLSWFGLSWFGPKLFQVLRDRDCFASMVALRQIVFPPHVDF